MSLAAKLSQVENKPSFQAYMKFLMEDQTKLFITQRVADKTVASKKFDAYILINGELVRVNGLLREFNYSDLDKEFRIIRKSHNCTAKAILSDFKDMTSNPSLIAQEF